MPLYSRSHQPGFLFPSELDTQGRGPFPCVSHCLREMRVSLWERSDVHQEWTLLPVNNQTPLNKINEHWQAQAQPHSNVDSANDRHWLLGCRCTFENTRPHPHWAWAILPLSLPKHPKLLQNRFFLSFPIEQKRRNAKKNLFLSKANCPVRFRQKRVKESEYRHSFAVPKSHTCKPEVQLGQEYKVPLIASSWAHTQQLLQLLQDPIKPTVTSCLQDIYQYRLLPTGFPSLANSTKETLHTVRNVYFFCKSSLGVLPCVWSLREVQCNWALQ